MSASSNGAVGTCRLHCSFNGYTFNLQIISFDFRQCVIIIIIIIIHRLSFINILHRLFFHLARIRSALMAPNVTTQRCTYFSLIVPCILLLFFPFSFLFLNAFTNIHETYESTTFERIYKEKKKRWAALTIRINPRQHDATGHKFIT